MLENAELQSRLALAEKWMRREIKGAISHVQELSLKKKHRSDLHLFLENEGLDIITKRVLGEFSEVLDAAPKYTLERLIDAEIYWSTLQKYATMDGLPIILAYQKILDAWIEEVLIRDWRIVAKKTLTSSQYEHESLERDLWSVFSKNYTLSIGRLYQLLEIFRTDKENLWEIQKHLFTYWEEKYPKLLAFLLWDDFFTEFQKLIDSEVFAKKRHESKVRYVDVKNTRDILPPLLLSIFRFSI